MSEYPRRLQQDESVGHHTLSIQWSQPVQRHDAPTGQTARRTQSLLAHRRADQSEWRGTQHNSRIVEFGTASSTRMTPTRGAPTRSRQHENSSPPSRERQHYALIVFVTQEYASRNKDQVSRTFGSLKNSSAEPLITFPGQLGKIDIHRWKALENRLPVPYCDLTFFDTPADVTCMSQLGTPNGYDRLDDIGDAGIEHGCYQRMQLVQLDEQRKPITDASINEKGFDNSSQGYIMLAYRTMADMYSREFAENWKTWTGVRLINQTMPKHIDIRKIEFYRNLKGNSTAFHYVLLMEIGNLIPYAHEILNVLGQLKARLSGYLSVYHDVPHSVSSAIERVLSSHSTPTHYSEPPRRNQERSEVNTANIYGKLTEDNDYDQIYEASDYVWSDDNIHLISELRLPTFYTSANLQRHDAEPSMINFSPTDSDTFTGADYVRHKQHMS